MAWLARAHMCLRYAAGARTGAPPHPFGYGLFCFETARAAAHAAKRWWLEVGMTPRGLTRRVAVMRVRAADPWFPPDRVPPITLFARGEVHPTRPTSPGVEVPPYTLMVRAVTPEAVAWFDGHRWGGDPEVIGAAELGYGG